MVLIDVAAAGLPVSIDLRYASERNFTGRPIYARAGCYLHGAAAERLARAAALATALDLRLHVFDAYRPVEAQWALWRHTPDATFVADPRRGSPHSRGAAVDLTLAEAASGRLLPMGTDFDCFTDQAHHGRIDVSRAAQVNRLTLLGLMSAAGWDFYGKEWWHYQLFGAWRLPLFADGAAAPPLMAG
ncbi:MAG: D-alanyl-D-alanine dipeptidase [Alphaproteobacteria bacterium]|nr:D-alanyl-D-alanine dipeptidase [Alphaproteobacteria bacterium]